MLLTYNAITDLLRSNAVSGYNPRSINAASLDVHLSDSFYREDVSYEQGKSWLVDLSKSQSPTFRPIGTPFLTDGVPIQPGEFILASTKEIFNLPDDVSALFVMKSSLARAGLNQMNAAWCSPGWTGSALTLELMNETTRHTLVVRPGMAIGQMVFFRGSPAPEHVLYVNRGRYNHQPAAQLALPSTGDSEQKL